MNTTTATRAGSVAMLPFQVIHGDVVDLQRHCATPLILFKESSYAST
ncbi:hypothetical protein PMI21_00069 [Pseudomonas sp. GM18]|nr:hypothetical protein PMI21_00069 [Pseudomonas sp. GM18]